MAKTSRPRGTKGSAPPLAEPSQATIQAEDLVALNFKVPAEFRRAFKLYATERGLSMVELLRRAFAAYQGHH